MLRDVLAEFLNAKYQCTVTDSAEGAMACLQTEEFDLVLTDIKMGGMSGLSLVPMIHEIDPDQVVVITSGGYVIQTAIDAIRVKAYDYLLKPFSLQQLELVVSRAITHHKLLTAKRQNETVLKELVRRRTAELENAISAVESAYRSTLTALVAALETRDTECFGHSERVLNYSLRLGSEMYLSPDELRSLEFGAVLHDIGKIGVPDTILRKPGALTDAEWTQMKQHPFRGQQIVRNVNFLGGAALVVGQHHEKWDGSGYPLGIAGENIDIKARIFAVVDAFEAMTTEKPYRQAFSVDHAIEELDRCAGGHFDPKVVEAFHRIPTAHWAKIREASLGPKDSSGPVYTDIQPGLTSVEPPPHGLLNFPYTVQEKPETRMKS